MAWVKNTSWSKEVQKILDAPNDFQRAFDASWENYEGI